MKSLRQLNPKTVALAYSILASISTVLASMLEGTLTGAQEITIQSQHFVVNPLLYNYSTLIDFAILNPLTIYFLVLCYKNARTKNHRVDGVQFPSVYHRWGMAVLCLVVSGAFMYWYYQGFLEGDFFDAVIKPNTEGVPRVTVTGWIVYFWTTIMIFILLFFSINHLYYVRYLLSLTHNSINYKPKHEDNAGGQSYLSRPLFNYFNACLILLLIFAIFIVYDRTGDVEESRRSAGFLVFLLMAGPMLIIPTLHLHKLMRIRKNEYVSAIRRKTNRVYEALLQDQQENLNRVVDELNYITYLERYNHLVRQLPSWPMPLLKFTFPLLVLSLAAIKVILDWFQHLV